jgi:hypothetical protein
MDEIDRYIKDYQLNDRSRIVFASNGEQGSKLRDENSKESGIVSTDELIRELYDAETAWSKAAWAVRHQFVVFLASELLKRGGEDNVRCYLQCCVGRGQDAYFSSLCVTLTSAQREQAIVEIDSIINRENLTVLPGWNRIRKSIAQGQ